MDDMAMLYMVKFYMISGITKVPDACRTQSKKATSSESCLAARMLASVSQLLLPET
jgi:hypothetical protein